MIWYAKTMMALKVDFYYIFANNSKAKEHEERNFLFFFGKNVVKSYLQSQIKFFTLIKF